MSEGSSFHGRCHIGNGVTEDPRIRLIKRPSYFHGLLIKLSAFSRCIVLMVMSMPISLVIPKFVMVLAEIIHHFLVEGDFLMSWVWYEALLSGFEYIQILFGDFRLVVRGINWVASELDGTGMGAAFEVWGVQWNTSSDSSLVN
jgi:hypothetical protein